MKILTIPNGLTAIRFAIAGWFLYVAFFGAMTYNVMWWSFWLFLVGAATDYLDGVIARSWPNQQSKLGEWIDPPADKLLVLAYMIFLYVSGIATGTFEVIAGVLIVLREVIMIVWRAVGGADLLPVSWVGKWKTAFQLGALAAYGVYPILPELRLEIGPIVLVTAVGFTYYSLAHYVLQKRGPATA